MSFHPLHPSNRDHRRLLLRRLPPLRAIACVAVAVTFLFPVVAVFADTVSSAAVQSQNVVLPSDAAPIRVDSANQIAIRLSALGGGTTLSVQPDGAVDSTSVPIPVGYHVVALEGEWQRTSDVTSGNFSIEQGGRVLQSSDVSTIPVTPTAVSIPLEDAQLTNNTFAIDFRLRPGASEAACSPFSKDAGISLFDAAVVLQGDDTVPATVSDFFPTALRDLEIVVPSQPTSGTSQAALTLAAAAVRLSHALPSDIAVVSTASNGDPGPLQRRIVIDPTAPHGTTVNGRTLQLGGTDDQLRQESQLFATGSLPAAQSTAISVDAVTADANAQKTLYSFDDLGVGNLAFDGEGRLERTINISQAQLGGPITAWSFRFLANYAPPAHNATVTFSVLAGGTLVHSINLDSSGHLDQTVTIPPVVAGRDLALTLRFDTASHEAACTDTGRFDATVLSASSLDVSRGQDESAGFVRWPQAGLSTLHVAFDAPSVTSLNAATSTLATLQSASSAPIAFAVADTLDGNTPTPLFAVVTKSPVASFLDPPLTGPGVRLVDSGGKNVVTLQAEVQLTSLQAYTNNGGNVLLLAGASADADQRLAQTLSMQPNGWFGLTGDVWFAADAHAPVSMQVRGGALHAKPLTPELPTFFERHRDVIVVIAIVIVLILLAILYPRLVSERPRTADAAEESKEKDGEGSPGEDASS